MKDTTCTIIFDWNWKSLHFARFEPALAIYAAGPLKGNRYPTCNYFGHNNMVNVFAKKLRS